MGGDVLSRTRRLANASLAGALAITLTGMPALAWAEEDAGAEDMLEVLDAQEQPAPAMAPPAPEPVPEPEPVTEPDLELLATATTAEDVTAALSAGTSVVLAADVTIEGTLAVAGAPTLDLAGHTLTIAAGKNAGCLIDGTGGALVYMGAGAFTIKGGTVDITLGNAYESRNTALYGYSGITVAGGGTLQATDATLKVRYTGASTARPVFSLYGIAVRSGKVALSGKTALAVESAPAADAFGATNATGIFVPDAARTSKVDVASQASISVTNTSAALTQGVNAADAGALTGTNSNKNAALAELDLATAPQALVNQITKDFLELARLDAEIDEAGYVYGANVYYLPAHQLECGITVWAYSDPVPSADLGKQAAIVPAHVFVRTAYADPLQALGIAVGENFKGSIAAQGKIEVRTGEGRAIGVLKAEGGSYQVAEQAISAQAATAPYITQTGSFDLRNSMTFTPEINEPVTYVESALVTTAEQVVPVASAVAQVGSVVDKVVPGNAAAAQAIAGYDTMQLPESEQSVNTALTFWYWRPTSTGDYLYSGAAVTGYDGVANAITEANKFAQVGSTVVVNGTTYTLKGWSTRRSDLQPLFTTSLPVRTSSSSLGERSIYFGIYEAEGRTMSVDFYVDGTLYAQVASLPTSTTIDAALAQSSNPEKPTSTREGVTFRGWSMRPNSVTYMYGNLRTLGEISGGADKVALYAVWSDATGAAPEEKPDANQNPSDNQAEAPQVTFYDADAQTVLERFVVEASKTVFESTGEDPRPRTANADLFQYWMCADGTRFSPTGTPVTASMNVYAVYLATNAGGGGLTGSGGSGNAGAVLPTASNGAALARSGGQGALAREQMAAGTAQNAAPVLKDEATAAEVLAASAAAWAEGADDCAPTEAAEIGVMSAATSANSSDAGTPGGLSEEDANTTGFVASASSFAVAIGAVAAWFVRRHSGEEDEEIDAAVEGGTPAQESIVF